MVQDHVVLEHNIPGAYGPGPQVEAKISKKLLMLFQ